MARRRIAAPSVLPLRVNDLLFVNAYEAAGFRSPAHIDAYQSVHPRCKRASARVGAERILQKPVVKEEIARRIQFDAGITRAHIESSLLKYQAWADEKQDYIAGASICMDAAKLAGLITEKREVTTLTEEKKSALRALLDRLEYDPSSTAVKPATRNEETAAATSAPTLSG